MNLAQHVKSLFFEQNQDKVIISPVEEIKPKKRENLVVVVVPRKCLPGLDYKERGMVVSGNFGKYFHGCALDVGKALLTAYGDFFDVATTERDHGITYDFNRGERTVTYALLGRPNFESTGGQRFSSDISGLLNIQEPALDLELAGKFLTVIMESHLLDYREHTPAKFGVFYEKGGDQENEPKLEGISLLRQMGVAPTEAAQFQQIMYFGGYEHKVFQPGKLNL